MLRPVLDALLAKICDRREGRFVVDETAYRRMLFHEYHVAFLAACVKEYPRHRRHYVTRPLTYHSWRILVNQIGAENK
jgi:hypothetical protein